MVLGDFFALSQEKTSKIAEFLSKIMFFKMAIVLICLSFSCSASIDQMTLEEKVGQLLMVHFNGEVANDDAKTLIQKIGVGGFIYYNWANGLNSPEQVLGLSVSLQKLSDKIPLFIAVDQEGGLVARLTKGFTVFPGNKALGMAGECELAEEVAFAMGQELKAVGVNFNLAPVVDVNSNPRNPVIGIRSFGSSTDVVIPFARKAVLGFQRAGIITSLKHFPGHGDVEVDSHQDLPVITKSRKGLEDVELLPFKELSSLADTIMTAHIVVPSVDPVNCATLSKKVLDILRDEMGFEGVIISDSLVMEGLLKNCASIEEAAIRALNAGCDMLILGGKQLIGSHVNLELTVRDVERIHRALVDAVKRGFVTVKRVDEAVERILKLKGKYELTLIGENKAKGHDLLAKKIAAKALKVAGNKIIGINESRVAVIAPDIVKDSVRQTSLLALGKENYSYFFKGLNPSDEEIKAAKETLKKTDILIFCSYNAWKNSAQVFLAEEGKPLVVICLRDPLDADLFPRAKVVLTTFSPTVPSIQAACEELTLLNEGK